MMHRMKRALLVTTGALLILVTLVYVGDYLSVRFQIPKRELYSTIKIQPYYAVKLKDNKTEFDFLAPQTEVCIHSLFPHFGHRPCWYVSRHTQKRIDM